MGKRVIPDEIKCAIFDFIQKAEEIPDLVSATLFGSIILGDFSKKSDIDISLLFNTDHNPEIVRQLPIVGIGGRVYGGNWYEEK